MKKSRGRLSPAASIWRRTVPGVAEVAEGTPLAASARGGGLLELGPEWCRRRDRSRPAQRTTAPSRTSGSDIVRAEPFDAIDLDLSLIWADVPPEDEEGESSS